ncbi:MAG: TonB-dependent receptor [Acidobacteria bacterium]|nr:MAG: TonB-dependent receptor [Acidobacteriota bacterium]
MKDSRGSSARALAFAALALASAFPALAEDPAAVSGTVRALDGSALPGTRVTLVEPTRRLTVRVTSGDHGVFRASSLPPGTWTLTAELAGFLPRTLDPLFLSAGERLTVEVRLEVATVREALTVLGSAPRDTLEASEIRESPARDVGEALSGVPGVAKLRKGGIASDVVVRGYQTKDLNVLVDGQRVYGACPNHMDPPAFHVDFAEVDRVEVGKGPFDVRNQGSLGGVVNVVTRKPEAGFHASATVAGGSWGYVNPVVTASYGTSAASLLAGYSYRRGDVFADGDGRRFTELANYRPGAGEEAAFSVGSAFGKLVLAPAAGHTVQVAYTRQDAGTTFYPYLQMDAEYDDSDRVNVSWEADLPGGTVSSVRAQGYYTRVSHWMTDAFRTTSTTAPRGWSMGTMADTRTAGGRVEGRVGPVALGVEAFQRFWEARTQLAGMAYATQYSVPAAKTESAGLWAELTQPLGERLSLSAGARLERTRTEADPEKANTDLWQAYNGTRETSAADVLPSGSLRLSWRVAEGLEASAGVGHTTRVPEPNERYFALKRMGTDWVGNPDLAPSRNTGADLALAFRRAGLSLSASGFWNRVADWVAVHDQPKVESVPGVMNQKARSYANVDATLAGFELSGVVAVLDRLFASGSVSYVRGTQDGNGARGIAAGDLPEMPPLSGRAALRYDTGSLYGEAEGVFASAQRHVDASLLESPTPGWGVLNLKLGGAIGPVDLSAGVANVFDRTYREHLSYQRDPFRSGTLVYEPGRAYFATATYRY